MAKAGNPVADALRAAAAALEEAADAIEEAVKGKGKGGDDEEEAPPKRTRGKGKAKEEEEVTFDDLKAGLVKLSKKDKDTAKKLLKKFKIEKLSDLDEDDYAKFKAALDTALGDEDEEEESDDDEMFD